mgnify:CR=1 FL=1
MSCPQDTDRFLRFAALASEETVSKREAAHPFATYTDVEEILRTLAYAELRAVMLAWARVPARDPVELVRAAIDRVLAAAPRISTCFGETLRDALRSETAAAFDQAIRKAGPIPWQRSVAPGQVGEAAGLEIIFHEAGEAAARIRANDPRMLSIAVALTDYVREHARARTRSVRGTAPP